LDVQEVLGAVGEGARYCLLGLGADLGVTVIVLSKNSRQVRFGMKSLSGRNVKSLSVRNVRSGVAWVLTWTSRAAAIPIVAKMREEFIV
jgi:hypothetical protein